MTTVLELFDVLLTHSDAILQTDIQRETDGIFGLAGGGIGAFLSTLIVGAILLALIPDYTVHKVKNVYGDPVTSFLYGFLALVLLLIAVVILVISIVGILVAIPLVILAWLVWAVGATIAFLAIGDRLVGHSDGWVKPLLVGAAINGGLALTGIGGIVSFIIGAIGFGTILRDYT